MTAESADRFEADRTRRTLHPTSRTSWPIATDRPANRLADETSPYLLQHAHNPVDWYPLGRRGVRAGRRPRTGRSSCRSATRPATGATSWSGRASRTRTIAALDERALRQHQGRPRGAARPRPDLHDAVQAMTGHGGWPMSVFLTPDGRPFYGGTYFPPRDARGMPGFPRVLLSVHQAWDERRDEIVRVGRRDDRAAATRWAASRPSDGDLDAALLDDAARALGHAVRPAARRVRLGAEVPAPDGPPRPAPPPRPDRRRPRPAHGPAHARQAWPGAASTTTSAAASPATRPTTAGWSPTSRRCSTTMRCSVRPISRPIQLDRRSRVRPASPARRSTTSSAG